MCPTPEARWIKFTAVAAKAAAAAKTKAPDVNEQLLPRVIVYDEATGVPQTEQDAREAKEKAPPARAEIPWQEWLRSKVAQSLDSDAAAVAAVTVVLASLHRSWKLDEQRVAISMDMDSKQITAQARGDLEPGSLELPPCAPVAHKILATSSHPQRVPIRVTSRVHVERGCARRQHTKTPEQPDDDIIADTRTFYIHPEYKLPEDATPGDAVASGADASTHAWQWKGDESLHPFWAIPRLSADDLRKENATKGGHRTFNVAMQEKQYNVVTVGDLKGHSVSTTWSVSVPMVTNTERIASGQEFLLEAIAKPAVATKRKTADWKDDVAAAAKAKDKAKVKAPRVRSGRADEREV